MSLIVSRFCILFSRRAHSVLCKRVTLLKRCAMGKVWYMFCLVTVLYHTAIIATNLMVFCV
ncbi:hypothetical protein E4Z61_14225 [Citrobacter tructae]|uniref:Uncharacterized protein n=1 Tax=Citrobacter tructae TaxID=2562449 RepID=A0ABX5T7I6_9ENTR|nr:hypothetical protein E4Z61_14225 [Citrobacter tructae]